MEPPRTSLANRYGKDLPGISYLGRVEQVGSSPELTPLRSQCESKPGGGWWWQKYGSGVQQLQFLVE